MTRAAAAAIASVAGACLLAAAPRALAQGRPLIDFGIVAPTAGSISYDGAGGPLIGDSISVDNVVGINTPLRGGQMRTCVSCTLAFSSGLFQTHDSTTWYFDAGGSISLVGGVNLDDDPDNIIGRDDIPTGTVLLSGAFSDEATVTFVGGSFRIVGAAFTDTKPTALTDFFGMPASTVYDGGLNISFKSPKTPPYGFISKRLFSGDVFNTADLPPPTATITPTATDTPEGPTATPTITPTVTDTPAEPTATPTTTPTGTETEVPAECPNGIVEDGEECDDGNPFQGDGCEPNCTKSNECNYTRPETPDEVYVNDDTADGTPSQCGSPDFTDIQSAIDNGAVSDGDIVWICPGTYTDPIVVSKEITLRSTDGPAVTIIHTGNDIALDLRRSAIRIDGLTIISDTAAAIDANRICPLSDASCATPGARGSNLVIANSIIKDSGTGIDWSGKIDCVDIIDNNFADNGKHVLINHNVADGGPSILVRILRNVVERGGMITMAGLTVLGNEAIVEDNRINDTVGDALLVGTATFTVRRNVIQRSGRDGIVVQGDGISCARVPPAGLPRPCLQITENNIYDNVDDGIRVLAGPQTVDTGIHCNNFERNGVGLGNEAAAGQLDATENWWGSNSGPSGVHGGTGDRIENRSGATTLFIEFLCAPCPQGFPSVNGVCEAIPSLLPQFPGYDPDVDPNGRHIAFVSNHDLDIDPRTDAMSFNNDDMSGEVFLLTREAPKKLGGICVGGTINGDPCFKDTDCPADLSTDPIILNGACVLLTQLSNDPNSGGQCYTPRLSLFANNVLFESQSDLVPGGNPDGSMEVFRWNKKTFKNAPADALTMLTSSNGLASDNGDLHLRRPVFESTGDFNNDPLTNHYDNSDGNSEIFLFDIRRNRYTQLTNSVAPADSRRPVNGRRTKFIFDSNGDLDNDPKTTFSASPCPGGGPNGNGNADGNREIFLVKRGLRAVVISQITNSCSPDDNRAGGLGFHNKIVAFASNGNYVLLNPDANWEIFTVFKGAFAQVTMSAGGENVNPAMNFRARFVVFESTADLQFNGSTNRRIFMFDRNTNQLNLLSKASIGTNRHPRISSGRFVVWDSDVDLTVSPPVLLLERVIYLYDRQQDD